MLIAEVLSLVPESAEILADYGLNCISCGANTFEPLREGALVHGIGEKDVERLIEKLNTIAHAKRKASKTKGVDGPYLTPLAVQKIIESAKEDGKEGYGLKITASTKDNPKPVYGMDFKKRPSRGDKTIVIKSITLFIDPASFKYLKKATIDFIDSPYGSGFKVFDD